MRMFKRFIQDETGATAIEYGLIVALITLAIIGAVTAVGNNTGTVLNYVSQTMSNAMGRS
jgi:pilus assembly protein Flp/PilA